MSAGWLVTNAVAALLLPPLLFVVPAAAGILLRRRYPAATTVALCSLALLIMLSTGACARLLMRPLENESPPFSGVGRADAIVILGGGRQRNAPEYGGSDVPFTGSLARLRYGARLQRQTGLPILVTGGSPDGASEPEAELMARALREDFVVPVRWIEGKSINTAENARYSADLLHQAGMRRILLVTDAVHMPRAQRIFSRVGLDVIAAATNYQAQGSLQLVDFIPGAAALRNSAYAMHEWVGLLWYEVAHRHPSNMNRMLYTDNCCGHRTPSVYFPNRNNFFV
jgi:uncharacterized SAM-binding protein YcdF (DUF218 family)